MARKILTTSSGAPVVDDQNSVTAGPRGPLLIQDWQLIEKLAHFNRERIPERIVHAKGSGAHGTFTLTRDLSDYTIADHLNGKGKQTEVFARFSTVGGEMGSADAERDPRGFAVKLYTRQGNHDIVGNNTPVFFLRDPSKFPDFIHTQKRNPVTNCKDPEAMWDFWSLNPQSIHQVTILFSERGVPATYRHMNGYSSHTYSMWNKKGERFWVKWHFKTRQGIQCLTQAESRRVCGVDPDHAQRDLVEAIESGNHPRWTVNLQIMAEVEAESYHIHPFDLTKVWPHGDYPLLDIGVLELNRNVENYFAETEQAAFSPSNLVPGIGVSPDKMLQARLFAYQDAHRYRIGANYNDLPVNYPRSAQPANYQRGGVMAGTRCPFGNGNNLSGSAEVNYGPNSNDGPVEHSAFKEPPMPFAAGVIDRHDHRPEADDYTQAGALFRLMNADQKQQLADNIAGSLAGTSKPVRERMLSQFDQCDPEYGRMVKEALAIR
ncbi:MAG: catalase [Gammaproteobacteria bacterium RBG_16_51_14]|nr:MAG: catalase [Gammaproteobacteria bacterium RBG_16_51_14]